MYTSQPNVHGTNTSNSVLEGLWDVRSNELLNLDIDLFMRRNLLRVEDTLNDVTARQYFRS